MPLVLTIIVKPNNASLLEILRQKAISALNSSGCHISNIDMLSEGEALDIFFEGMADKTLIKAALKECDWAIQSVKTREKSLLLADMDSTIITVECIDELADFVGKKDQVAAITEKAMQGLINFNDALVERVALLKGLSLDTLQQCYDERVTLTSGAKELVATMRARGAYTAMVSGGFTFFTDRVSKKLGLDQTSANILDHADGKLTGRVLTPIVNADTKKATLLALQKHHQLPTNAILAVGDGANDIPMLQAAGLGVAFYAKPSTAKAASLGINHGDLTALLFLQGIKRGAFVG